jgi:YidC/Oxa1 family membrane protein insertase
MGLKQQKVLKTMSIVMLPISTVVSLFLPSGIQFYFFASSLLHLLQSYVTHANWFRRWVGMTPLVEAVPLTGVSWQPPRVVDAHAPRVKSANPAAAAQSDSVFSSFQSTIDMAKEKLNEYGDRNTLENAQKSARDYEMKRALEEKEKYLSRVNGKRGRSDEHR